MAEFSVGNICSWLLDLPESFEHSPEPTNPAPAAWSTGGKKRKADQQLTPPTTPRNMDDVDVTTPRKRPRQLRQSEDVELTPRPPRRTARACSTSSSSQASLQSRSPSPLKRQLMALRLDESGLEFRQLHIDEPPIPAVIDLFSDLRDIGNGIEILPEDLRISITNGLSISGPTAHAWRFSFRADTPRDLPGRIPSPKAIISVREWAKKCHEAEHEEAAWGEEVHHRLLEAVFRNSGTDKGQQFDFTSCQTARPHQRWLPQSGRANMIDKCIYYDTSEDTGYAQALRELSKHAPTLTMGTWHAAQWAFLRWAVLAALQRGNRDEDLVTLEEQADENLSELPFLIGIVVEGHSWAFTLSTREQSKTISWEDHRFRTTENNLDICKAAAGLRRITA
ncbi:hypothetical protein H634G_11072 [Metarhizium anisopliae BRIP 53293]|uniref:PD-(D/E)XK nuclease-like domain-containing protein n=1 Tax=Metarhizium anisopliae BRIP 53293 TaxID=1291518 RepID=A0A0D9NID5_METAN|nr:hypothetical protein H634G_11072 [Metarhizium anisopliae BRIP 53293]